MQLCMHYVPRGSNAVPQMTHFGEPLLQPPRNFGGPPLAKNGMCDKFDTAQGCKFGMETHFGHSGREIGEPITPLHRDVQRVRGLMAPAMGRIGPPLVVRGAPP